MRDDFQPGGRPPAPAQLRVVQDFVNTEVPDFHQDDVATPGALADWLARRGLVAAGDSVDAALFVEARALRAALRELALANTLGSPPSPARSDEIDATLRAFPLAVRLKACRQETCGWVFYDGSRNRSSSWCSMRVCGGRAKASSYRRRHGAGTAR